MNYKINLDYRVLKPELDKKYEPGVAAIAALMALDPEYAGKGLGKLMNYEDVRILYGSGF